MWRFSNSFVHLLFRMGSRQAKKTNKQYNKTTLYTQRYYYRASFCEVHVQKCVWTGSDCSSCKVKPNLHRHAHRLHSGSTHKVYFLPKYMIKMRLNNCRRFTSQKKRVSKRNVSSRSNKNRITRNTSIFYLFLWNTSYFSVTWQSVDITHLV